MRKCHFCNRTILPDDDVHDSPVCRYCADAIKDVMRR